MSTDVGQRLLPLAEALDPEEAGRKAAGLAAASAAGFRVPDARVVPVTVTRRLQEGDDPDLRGLLAGVLEELGGTVAVRSSAVDEDLADASYAGQYATVLGVRDEAGLLEAVRTCVGSVDTGSAVSYRTRSHGASRDIAVLVQRMLAPQVAGVAFGVDPVSGRDHVVIDATAGVADRLLDGEVTAEHWVVTDRPVLDSTPAARVLTEAQAADVADLCRAVGSWAGGPVDLEWALADGRLHLLQTRPVTAVPLEPAERPPEGETWVREPRFDDAIDPLTFSAWLPVHGDSLAWVLARFGVPVERLSSRRYLGRVYTRSVPLAGGRDGSAPPPRVVSLLMHVVPALRRRLAQAHRALAEDRAGAALDDWDGEARDRTRAETRRLRETDRTALSDDALAAHLDDVVAHLREVARRHFEVMFAGTLLPTGQLGMFLEDRLGWSATETIGLVSGFGSASVEHGRALADLADRLGAEGVDRVTRDPGALLADPAFDAYLDRFGHRAGASLSTPTEAEMPATIAHHLRRVLAAGRAARRSDPAEHARELEERARALLADPADAAHFDEILARARRGRPYGDETEGDVLNVLALVRYVALEAAARLVRAGRLDRPDDVWFLELDELRALLGSSGSSGSIGSAGSAGEMPDLERRRREHLWSQSNPVPEHFGPAPVPPPEPSVIPRRARPIVGALMWSLATLGVDPTGGAGAGAAAADADADAQDGILVGLAGSPGRASGPVRIIRGPAEFDRVHPGDVLVAPMTMASWSPVFAVVAALVTERGGPLSHPATLAREYGIPAVLAVPGATTTLQEGATVAVDGSGGRVTVL